MVSLCPAIRHVTTSPKLVVFIRLSSRCFWHRHLHVLALISVIMSWKRRKDFITPFWGPLSPFHLYQTICKCAFYLIQQHYDWKCISTLIKMLSYRLIFLWYNLVYLSNFSSLALIPMKCKDPPEEISGIPLNLKREQWQKLESLFKGARFRTWFQKLQTAARHCSLCRTQTDKLHQQRA